MSSSVPNGEPHQEVASEATKPVTKTISIGTDPTAVIPQFWAPPGMETDKEIIPVDINQQGQLLLKRAPSYQDAIAHLINQIWEEAPNSFESLKVEVSPEADKKKETAPEADNEFSLEKFNQMRANLAQRLCEAHNESLIALNLMNVIVSNPGINPSATSGNEKEFTQPPIPPETLRATYANPPRLDLKRRIRDMKLQLASKRQQLNNASQLLNRRMERVKEVNQIEKSFWTKLIQLRTLGWMLQSPKPHLTYRGPRPFYINYGFSHAGSKFNMSGVAIVTRCEDTPGDLKIEPQFDHRTTKTVVMQIVSSDEDVSNPELAVGRPLRRFLLPTAPVAEGLVLDNQTLASHCLLQNARNTLLETELFFHLTQEARALDSVAGLSKNSIVIQIDDTRKLIILLEESDDLDAPSTAPTASSELELCVDLKLMMLGRLRLHHQHHLEMRRRKLTSSLPTSSIQTSLNALTQVRDPGILRFTIEITRYHFFHKQIWNTALDVISGFSQDSSRIKSELIPLPGTRTAMFQSSHLLQVMVDNAHFIQFKLSSPRHLQALLPKTCLSLDREVGMFSRILADEIKTCITFLNSS
ncbi:hypothetical protein DSO57_1000863 [Entomophthora muscae]|uniref:Uncharacterized protein n=2 Tax=Entomophthora muscae TaxID=34485 RepID=A0ACC2U7P1_9FUNG|nr:hypothetical protein DSO57_1000863 [Entomophthora muscae]